MTQEQRKIMSASDLIIGMRKLLQTYNETNEAGIERIDVECRDTSTLGGKDYTYDFHIMFTK